MSHTPAPWEIELDDNPHRVRGILGPWTDGPTDGGEDIESEWDERYTRILRWRRRIVETDSGVYPPRMADAQLIAAAPELLEVLRKLRTEASGFVALANPAIHGLVNIGVLRTRIAEADAIIAKAEGRS